MTVEITVDDLKPFAPNIDAAKGAAMIADALAMAVLVAPCIHDGDFEHADAVKAIIRGAVLRWNDAGSGAVTQWSSGPHSQTVTESAHKTLFYPSEISELSRLCKTNSGGKAFSVNTLPNPEVAYPFTPDPGVTW